MMSSLFQKVTYMLNQLFQAVMNPPLFVMKKNIFSFVVLLTKQINTLKLVLPFTADDKSPARVYFFFPLSLQKEEQWPKRYFATTNRRKKSRWMWFNTLCNFLHGQLLLSAAKSIWLALYMYNIASSREEKVWSNLRKSQIFKTMWFSGCHIKIKLGLNTSELHNVRNVNKWKNYTGPQILLDKYEDI